MSSTAKQKADAIGQRMERWNAEVRPLDQLKKWLWICARTLLIVGICYIILYPLITKLSMAIRDRMDLFDTTIVWIPRHFTWDNFKTAFDMLEYPAAFWNSAMLSLGTSVLQMISCALAGYGFARLKFRGRGILFTLVVFTIVIPPQTIMIPTYLNYRFFDIFGLYELFTGKQGVNLLESYWPFFISSTLAMGMKNGLFIFIFRQFFRGLPKELEEAAYVDGTGVLGTFWRVIIPNTVPAIVTVLLFSIVWQWNDNYYVSLYMNYTQVLSSTLASMPGALGRITTDPSYISQLMNTGALLVMMPMIILYVFAQKYFVESVERTGLVG